MEVRAVFRHGQFGFYGGKRRYDGDVFDIDSKHLAEWMEKIPGKKGRKPANEQPAQLEVTGYNIVETGAE